MGNFLTNIPLRYFRGGLGRLVAVVEMCNKETGFNVSVGRGNNKMPNDAAIYADPTRADHSEFWRAWDRHRERKKFFG